MATRWIIVFSLLLLPGLAGIILPVPGLAYMFLVALIFGLVNHFQQMTWQNLVVLGVILIISIITDAVSGIIGAKYGGASKQSMIAGFIGMIVGVMALPPFGGLLGIFLGVMIWEIISRSNRKKAMRAASASLIGSVAGMLLSLLLSLLFIVLFILFAIK